VFIGSDRVMWPLTRFKDAALMGPEEYLSPEKCRASACECYEMARKIGDPDARRELLSLVLKWYKLAEMIAAAQGKLH